MSELWNHYAGAIHKSKLPFVRIRVDRGRRLGGTSTWTWCTGGPRFVRHQHILDVVATRILIASIASVFVLVLALAAVVIIRLGTHLAIPGWATFTGGLGLLLVLQFVSMAFSLVFLMINTRQNTTVVPARDYRVFVDTVRRMWASAAPVAEVARDASS